MVVVVELMREDGKRAALVAIEQEGPALPEFVSYRSSVYRVNRTQPKSGNKRYTEVKAMAVMAVISCPSGGGA